MTRHPGSTAIGLSGLALLLAGLGGACSQSTEHQAAVCALMDVSGTYADQQEAVNRTLKAGVLSHMQPGDSLFVLVMCADYLETSPAGKRVMLVFSDMREELPTGVSRVFDPGELDGNSGSGPGACVPRDEALSGSGGPTGRSRRTGGAQAHCLVQPVRGSVRSSRCRRARQPGPCESCQTASWRGGSRTLERR